MLVATELLRELRAVRRAAWCGSCVLCGSGGACCYRMDVFSVVRHSRMWCPHDIGRDSGVWGEQGALETLNSLHEVGDEALTAGSPLSGDSVPWNGMG